MSALMTRRRRSPARDRDLRQTSLFSQLVSPPPVEPRDAVAAPLDVATASYESVELDDATTSYAGVELSLEDAITALWDDLTAGEVTDCPVCGEAMEPRHSAGAGVVGGRCTSCATSIA
jgi:hypothetical protein